MDMRSYKIESYVPEETFLLGKDARFCRAAFEDCFVIDLHSGPHIIASSRGNDLIETSMADTASLLNLFNGSCEPLILSGSKGTLLVYPTWQRLELALAFLLREDVQTVEKAYQNAGRYAFSLVFDTEKERENKPQADLEAKICALHFYMNRLFGVKREDNVMAQILMIANLLGCRLHEMSVSRTSITLDEREMEKLSAYLCCTFMTMRRYNGNISTSDKVTETPDFLTYASQEYGLYIQQSVKEKIAKPTVFDLPLEKDVAGFATHPAFANYKIEECDGTIRLHLPLHQKALLSSLSARGTENELVLTLFPLK